MVLFLPGPDALKQVQLNGDEGLLDADFPAHTGLGFSNRMGKRCLSELGGHFLILHDHCSFVSPNCFSA